MRRSIILGILVISSALLCFSLIMINPTVKSSSPQAEDDYIRLHKGKCDAPSGEFSCVMATHGEPSLEKRETGSDENGRNVPRN